MKAYLFAVYDAIGEPAYIVATSRGEAINKYLEKTGMPRDFFDRNCKIKNQGGTYYVTKEARKNRLERVNKGD